VTQTELNQKISIIEEFESFGGAPNLSSVLQEKATARAIPYFEEVYLTERHFSGRKEIPREENFKRKLTGTSVSNDQLLAPPQKKQSSINSMIEILKIENSKRDENKSFDSRSKRGRKNSFSMKSVIDAFEKSLDLSSKHKDKNLFQFVRGLNMNFGYEFFVSMRKSLSYLDNGKILSLVSNPKNSGNQIDLNPHLSNQFDEEEKIEVESFSEEQENALMINFSQSLQSSSIAQTTNFDIKIAEAKQRLLHSSSLLSAKKGSFIFSFGLFILVILLVCYCSFKAAEYSDELKMNKILSESILGFREIGYLSNLYAKIELQKLGVIDWLSPNSTKLLDAYNKYKISYASVRDGSAIDSNHIILKDIVLSPLLSSRQLNFLFYNILEELENNLKPDPTFEQIYRDYQISLLLNELSVLRQLYSNSFSRISNIRSSEQINITLILALLGIVLWGLLMFSSIFEIVHTNRKTERFWQLIQSFRKVDIEVWIDFYTSLGEDVLGYASRALTLRKSMSKLKTNKVAAKNKMLKKKSDKNNNSGVKSVKVNRFIIMKRRKEPLYCRRSIILSVSISSLIVIIFFVHLILSWDIKGNIVSQINLQNKFTELTFTGWHELSITYTRLIYEIRKTQSKELEETLVDVEKKKFSDYFVLSEDIMLYIDSQSLQNIEIRSTLEQDLDIKNDSLRTPMIAYKYVSGVLDNIQSQFYSGGALSYLNTHKLEVEDVENILTNLLDLFDSQEPILIRIIDTYRENLKILTWLFCLFLATIGTLMFIGIDFSLVGPERKTTKNVEKVLVLGPNEMLLMNPLAKNFYGKMKYK